MTSLILYPPENAIPITSTGLFILRLAPLRGSTIRDLVVIQLMGTVFFGVVPGVIQPQGLSGILYAGFIQNSSKGFDKTVISLNDFTQYVAYHPGTISLAGKPLSMVRGSPFISYATIMSSSIALSTGRLFTKSGTVGRVPVSSPLKETSTEPDLIPAVLMISLRREPLHLTFPMAPLPHCPPGTLGSKKLLPLP